MQTKEKELEKIPEAIQGTFRELLKAYPKTGEVEVKINNHRKTASLTMRGYTDVQSGEFFAFFDKNGKDRIVKYTKNKRLNLVKLDDRIEAIMISRHPVLTLGPDAAIKVVNKEIEASTFVSKREMSIDALTIVKGLNGVALRLFARLLFFGTKTKVGPSTSDQVIKQHLYEIIDNNPEKVINEWNDDTRYYRQIVREGLDKSYFTDKHGVYFLKNERIGNSFEEAVAWLKSQEDLIPKIEMELNKL